VGYFRRALDSLYHRNGTVVMGVLNATPDSFFDGGRWLGDEALLHVDELIAGGAGIIDVGGESTRPGAADISASEQIERIAPVLNHLAKHHQVLVTVDTTNSNVAEFALSHGAAAINDVSCLADPQLARVTAQHSAGLILMHSRGNMSQMSGFSQLPEGAYDDVVADVKREWCASRSIAVAAGLSTQDIAFDPGIGFWKSARHSFELLQRMGEFCELDAPIVIGASRKSFLTLIGESPPEQRLGGSIAACLYAAEHGVHVVRVHDVQATRQALDLSRALQEPIGSLQSCSEPRTTAC